MTSATSSMVSPPKVTFDNPFLSRVERRETRRLVQRQDIDLAGAGSLRLAFERHLQISPTAEGRVIPT